MVGGKKTVFILNVTHADTLLYGKTKFKILQVMFT